MNNDLPLISVIVPVYNAEEYLDKCVGSITNQTYTNLEIILVEDGSPDDSAHLCDEWLKRDTRVKIIHKSNGGAASARNAGIEIAEGEYLSFVDSDDYVELEFIEFLYKLLIDNNADVASCSEIVKDGENYYIDNKFVVDDGVYNGLQCVDQYFLEEKALYIGPHPKLYKKDIFLKLRFPNGKKKEDAYIFPHIYTRDVTVACSSKGLYCYVQHEGSLSHLEYSDDELEDRRAYRRYHYEFFESANLEPQKSYALNAYVDFLINMYFQIKSDIRRKEIEHEIRYLSKKLINCGLKRKKRVKYFITSIFPAVLAVSPKRIILRITKDRI